MAINSALRALNRFGLGARVGEQSRIGDPRAWLRAQLDGDVPTIAAPAAATPQALGDALRGLRMQGQATPEERQQARRRVGEIGNAETGAALAARVTSDQPFLERLVAFWSNHLCVSTGGKALVVPLAGSYEREAIRPRVLGRFEELVLASATHPAMLVYLDNFQSIGPSSQGARLSGRGNQGAPRGLNENYARELLELHTLGVNGGYTQQDVQELAKILTGWGISGLRGPGTRVQAQTRGVRRQGRGQNIQAPDNGPIRFFFQPALHEPGSKTVLGERYGEAGVAEGERAIRALCQHPSTVRFVARKLVTHFVSDEPPAAAVDRIAQVFRSSDGDLRAVAQALVELPEAWSEDARKFRTPQDWFVAVLRAFGSSDVNNNAANILRQLRQPVWSPASPKGYGDLMQEWADPDSLLNRGELARSLTSRPAMRNMDPRRLLDVVEVPDGNPLHGLLADNSIPAHERVALALAGPAFQWR
jgi:uncharacterized protein (DUF1800 family)